MLREEIFDATDVVRNLAAQPRPTDGLRAGHALTTNVDDVVFNSHRAECSGLRSLSFCLVATNRIRGFEVETGVEKTFQNTHPRFVFAVMERENQDTARFHHAICFTPTIREDALV